MKIRERFRTFLLGDKVGTFGFRNEKVDEKSFIFSNFLGNCKIPFAPHKGYSIEMLSLNEQII